MNTMWMHTEEYGTKLVMTNVCGIVVSSGDQNVVRPVGTTNAKVLELSKGIDENILLLVFSLETSKIDNQN